MTVAGENDKQAQRKAAMTVLAHSDAAEISRRLQPIALPAYEIMREPEKGLKMIRGRIGGDGAPFNLGEATVSRATIRLSTGEIGFGHTLGLTGTRRELAAIFDALGSSRILSRDAVEEGVLTADFEPQGSKRPRPPGRETAATRSIHFYHAWCSGEAERWPRCRTACTGGFADRFCRSPDDVSRH